MRAVRNGGYYQLRFEQGEDLPTVLAEFVRRRRIRSGTVFGLGAARRVVLGYFDVKKSRYIKRRFRGEYELAAVIGNIAWDGPDPICHLHAVVSGPTMATHGGHLFAAEVTATCELAVRPGPTRLKRAVDPATGLKLLDLPRVRA